MDEMICQEMEFLKSRTEGSRRMEAEVEIFQSAETRTVDHQELERR